MILAPLWRRINRLKAELAGSAPAELLGRMAFVPPEGKGATPGWHSYEVEAAPRAVSASETSFPPRTVAPMTIPALIRTMFLIMY